MIRDYIVFKPPSLMNFYFKTWIACLILQVPVALSTSERALFEHLFGNGKYSTHVRPVTESSHTVNVTLDFELNKIAYLHEKSQVFATVGFVIAEWKDEFLTWNPDDFDGISRMIIPPHDVWLPDFGVLNSVDTFYHEEFTRDFRVFLHSDGRITWSFGGTFQTSCYLDLKLYPFDIQKCSLQMENWAYTEDQVNLVVGHPTILLDHYTEDGTWNIERTKVTRTVIIYETHPEDHYPEIDFAVYLKRKSRYYNLNIVAPCALILFVALGIFWIPADSGEKIGFGVTVLLAFSVLQLVINEQTPQNSDNYPLLGVLVLSVMCLCGISVVCSILVLYLNNKGSQSRPPWWARKIFLQFLARAMCMGSHVIHEEQNNIKTISVVTEINQSLPCKEELEKTFNNTDHREIVSILRSIEEHMNRKVKAESVMDEWRSLAAAIDRFLFWITALVAFLLIGIIFSQFNLSLEDKVTGSMHNDH